MTTHEVTLKKDDYTRYEVLFYECQIWSKLDHWKITKYCDQDCLKTTLLLYTLRMEVQVSVKSAHFAQKDSIKKQPISNAGGFLKSNFDLIRIFQILLKQNN